MVEPAVPRRPSGPLRGTRTDETFEFGVTPVRLTWPGRGSRGLRQPGDAGAGVLLREVGEGDQGGQPRLDTVDRLVAGSRGVVDRLVGEASGALVRFATTGGPGLRGEPHRPACTRADGCSTVFATKSEARGTRRAARRTDRRGPLNEHRRLARRRRSSGAGRRGLPGGRPGSACAAWCPRRTAAPAAAARWGSPTTGRAAPGSARSGRSPRRGAGWRGSSPRPPARAVRCRAVPVAARNPPHHRTVHFDGADPSVSLAEEVLSRPALPSSPRRALPPPRRERRRRGRR